MVSTVNPEARIRKAETLLSSFDEDPTKSFEGLYRLYKPSLTTYASRRNAIDPDGVADLALFDGYRVIGNMRERKEVTFRAYIFRAVSSHMQNEQKKNKNKIIPIPAEINDDLLGVYEGFEAGVVDYAEVGGLLSELPPDQRAVVAHRFLDGLSGAETAKLLGKKENAVYQLQFRATRRLQRALIAAALALLAVVAIAAIRTQGTTVVVDSSPAERLEQPPINPDEERSIPMLTTLPNRQEASPEPAEADPPPSTQSRVVAGEIDAGLDEPTPKSYAAATPAVEDAEPAQATTTTAPPPTTPQTTAVEPKTTTPQTTTAELTTTTPQTTTAELTTTTPQTAPPASRIEIIANNDVVFGQVGEPLSLNIMNNDGPNMTFLDSVERVSGSVPGLALAADGWLAGTPTEAGTVTMFYKLIGTEGAWSFGQISITISTAG